MAPPGFDQDSLFGASASKLHVAPKIGSWKNFMDPKLLGTKGIATRNKDATRGAPGLTTRNKKLLGTIRG